MGGQWCGVEEHRDGPLGGQVAWDQHLGPTWEVGGDEGGVMVVWGRAGKGDRRDAGKPAR